jgi:NIMA (never in mitosis gene a)-related kinase
VQYIESFLERESLHIIMELCEHGDLKQNLKNRKGYLMEENTIWKYAIQAGLGLQWLHVNRILHRDIKTLNVFLTASDDARIGDLGVARVLSEGTNFANTLIGTPYYLSPELCEEKAYNDKSDVWAYGCVVYEMCTLRPPFDAKNQAALLCKILKGTRDAPVPASYSAELHALVDACLQQEAAHRPSMMEIFATSAAAEWASKMNIDMGTSSVTLEELPKRADARKRWRRLKTQVGRLHDDAVKDLDAPTRLVWDSLYRMLRAKMETELTDKDHHEIEKHVFEELPPEHTHLISKVCKILPLEMQCAEFQTLLNEPLLDETG